MLKAKYRCSDCSDTIRLRIESGDRTISAGCPRCGRTARLTLPDDPGDRLSPTCPICGCADLFQSKDFPKRAGLAIVVAAALASFVLFAQGRLIAAWLCLIGPVIVDLALYAMLPRVTTCYRCGAEYRGLRPNEAHGPFDLSTQEKYASQEKQPKE